LTRFPRAVSGLGSAARPRRASANNRCLVDGGLGLDGGLGPDGPVVAKAAALAARRRPSRGAPLGGRRNRSGGAHRGVFARFDQRPVSGSQLAHAEKQAEKTSEVMAERGSLKERAVAGRAGQGQLRQGGLT